MISFEDLNLIFYIGVFNTTIEVIMKKKSQLKQHFATTFRPLTPQKNHFRIQEHYFGQLRHDCTHVKQQFNSL